jgi:hypothetical protein
MLQLRGIFGAARNRGLEHRLNEVSAVSLRQIFVLDPNGVLLELNFFGA